MEGNSATKPKWTQIKDNVYLVYGQNGGNRFRLNGTNTYILGSGKKRIIIDTGDPNVEAYRRNLNEFIDLHNIEIEKIIVTHYHVDHIGGLSFLIGDMRTRGVEPKVYKKASDSEREKQYQTLYMFDIIDVQDNEVIEVEGAKAKIILTPGHSKDHLSILMEEEKLLFTGDCIIGTTSVAIENITEYMNSLQRLRDISTTQTITALCMGHGDICNTPTQKIDEYISYRMMKEAKLCKVIRVHNNYISKDELMHIMHPFLKEEKREVMINYARMFFQSTLDKLISENRIKHKKSHEGSGIGEDYYECVLENEIQLAKL